MIAVPLYASGYTCKCNGSCNYSKAYEEAGMPRYIDYEKYIKKKLCSWNAAGSSNWCLFENKILPKQIRCKESQIHFAQFFFNCF